jgi:hypothetical protein
LAQGQEVEFHEIEIQLFQEVEFPIMRSKFLIMNFCKIDQEIELALGALRELGKVRGQVRLG